MTQDAPPPPGSRLPPALDLAPFIYLTSRVHADHPVRLDGGPTAARDLWQACCHVLWHCHDGSLELADGDGVRLLRPGAVALAEPGTTAVLAPRTHALRLVFDLRWRRRHRGVLCPCMVERLPEPPWRTILGPPSPALLPSAEADRVAAMMERLRVVNLHDPCQRLWAQARLAAWIADRLGPPPSAPAAAPAPAAASAAGLADRVDQLIADHLQDGIDLKQIAARLGLSRQTLLRRYRRERGHPPRVGYHRIRLACARRMLACRDEALLDTARRCGFANLRSFCRWFRCHAGLPPGRWRRERRRGADDPLADAGDGPPAFGRGPRPRG